MSFNQELQEDLINSSILRSAFFNYFFRVFNNIADENFIGVSEKYLTYFNDLKDYVESNEYNNACQMFEEYINNEKNAVNIQDFLQRLNIEFTSLFLSGMGNIPASASSYLSSDGLLKGEEWEKVVKVYKMRDFQMPDSIKAPEDYISVEMLYMQKLSDLIGRLAEDGDINLLKATIDDQINFSSNHILVWIDMFADAVYSKSITLNSKLYASVAVIMKHYIKYDIELLKEFDEPTVVACKHSNPCGVASADNIYDAYMKAYNTDPVSIFGGIIVMNREVDKATAEEDPDVKDNTMVLYLNHIVADPEINDERLSAGTETRHFDLNYVLGGSEPETIIIKFKYSSKSTMDDAKESEIRINYKSIIDQYFGNNTNI